MNLDEACSNFKQEFEHYLKKENILKTNSINKYVVTKYNETVNKFGYNQTKPQLYVRF